MKRSEHEKSLILQLMEESSGDNYTIFSIIENKINTFNLLSIKNPKNICTFYFESDEYKKNPRLERIYVSVKLGEIYEIVKIECQYLGSTPLTQWISEYAKKNKNIISQHTQDNSSDPNIWFTIDYSNDPTAWFTINLEKIAEPTHRKIFFYDFLFKIRESYQQIESLIKILSQSFGINYKHLNPLTYADRLSESKKSLLQCGFFREMEKKLTNDQIIPSELNQATFKYWQTY